jgi:dTDP-4-amino-4,6-dideoxygalactose transaminase
MGWNIYRPVDDFEKAIAEYTGAPYACVVNSCTNALLLACEYLKVKEVSIPKRTYFSVPMSIVHAGGTVKFDDREGWQEQGLYRLNPYPIWDSARLMTSGMYEKLGNEFVCVSMHWAKTLNLGQGGVILHSDPEAQEWFRRMRFDGRTPEIPACEDKPKEVGWHCTMSPRDAADALMRLHFLPKHNPPMSPDVYQDLSKLEIFNGML